MRDERAPRQYEPPRIAERGRLDLPLIGITSPPVVCAAFNNNG